MLMTIVLEDATDELTPADKQLFTTGQSATLLYAEDTLLMGVNSASLQSLLEAVSKAGGKYGLELHTGKFQLLQIRTTASNDPRRRGHSADNLDDVLWIYFVGGWQRSQ